MGLAVPAAGLPPTAGDHLPDGVDNLKQMVLELLALRQSRAPGAEPVRSVAVHHLVRLVHLLDRW
jgi:hypothetical protein